MSGFGEKDKLGTYPYNRLWGEPGAPVRPKWFVRNDASVFRVIPFIEKMPLGGQGLSFLLLAEENQDEHQTTGSRGVGDDGRYFGQ